MRPRPRQRGDQEPANNAGDWDNTFAHRHSSDQSGTFVQSEQFVEAHGGGRQRGSPASMTAAPRRFGRAQDRPRKVGRKLFLADDEPK
jgi:hypothetical protein